MTDPRRFLDYLRHWDWYVGNPPEIPLSTDLDPVLPLPDLDGVAVVWPEKYAWAYGGNFLEMIKQALGSLVPLTTAGPAPKDRAWHEHGGFPVSKRDAGRLGAPCSPKDAFDIRGEVFEVRRGGSVIRCAYDYADYDVISDDVLDSVRHYFKCVMPRVTLPRKVESVGYFPSRPRILAKARAKVLRAAPAKDIDVYARFGTWTDSQGARETLVERVRAGGLRFQGGFGTVVFPRYMKELMRAKIALDAPGQAPITCRLPESTALGAVVVRAKPSCAFPEEMVDGVHYAEIKEDASNVVEVCRDLLEDPQKLARISRNALAYFDRNFSPQSIARRMLRSALT